MRQRRAEQQIEELRSEFTRYQAQVNEHFMESAHLLRRFNDAYRDVNQHMARGANRLCNDEDWMEELDQKSKGRLEHGSDGELQNHPGIMHPRPTLRPKARLPRTTAWTRARSARLDSKSEAAPRAA